MTGFARRHPAPAMDCDPAQGWRGRAACLAHDPELFYPHEGDNGGEAKKVCAGCPVRLDCLEAALGQREQFGVWGGLSPRERDEELKRRRS